MEWGCDHARASTIDRTDPGHQPGRRSTYPSRPSSPNTAAAAGPIHYFRRHSLNLGTGVARASMGYLFSLPHCLLYYRLLAFRRQATLLHILQLPDEGQDVPSCRLQNIRIDCICVVGWLVQMWVGATAD